MDKECLKGIKITPLLDTLRLQKIDDEVYFSEEYSKYISNSRLSLINPEQEGDPKAFFEGLSKHSKYSDALIFGSAVHELVLQPELFELCETVDRPTAKLGFMADELYNRYCNGTLTDGAIIAASNKINYYKGKMTSDRIQAVRDGCINYWQTRKSYEESRKDTNITPIFLDPKSRERVHECIKALTNNKKIMELLHPTGILEDPISENEQAILLDVEVEVPNYDPFILRLKAKLDNYTIDKETNTITINDVKTIGKIVSEFPNNFDKFHYHRELAIYSWMLSLVAQKYYGMENCKVKANCLVVSTIPKYYTSIYRVSKKDFLRGWEEFVYLLRMVAKYAATEYVAFIK